MRASLEVTAEPSRLVIVSPSVSPARAAPEFATVPATATPPLVAVPLTSTPRNAGRPIVIVSDACPARISSAMDFAVAIGMA